MATVAGSGGFWLAVALMVAVALAFVVPVLLRRPAAHPRPAAGAVNAAIHRSRLAELDEALAAGTMTPADHRACADDVLRQALADAPTGAAPSDVMRRWPALLVAVALPTLATAIYSATGDPSPLALRSGPHSPSPAAQLTRAELPAFATELEAHLAQSPADGRAWVLLARARFEADRFEDAAQAYERALASSRKVAADPQVWCELADALGMVQGGRLLGRPAELIGKALALNPKHSRALEMAGGAEYEAGHYDRALAHWNALLAVMPPGTPSRRELEMAVARLERLAAADAGVR